MQRYRRTWDGLEQHSCCKQDHPRHGMPRSRYMRLGSTVTRAPALVEQLVFDARLAKLCFPASALFVMLSRIKAQVDAHERS